MRPVFLAALLLLAVPTLARTQPIPARTQPIPARTQTTETTGDADVVKAAHLGTTGPALVEFFKNRTQRTAAPDKLRELIEQLGDKKADVRDKAYAGLVSAGMVAVPLLRPAAN